MNSLDLEGFEQAINTDLQSAVSTVVHACHNRVLSAHQIASVVEAIRTTYPTYLGGSHSGEPVSSWEYGDDFDVAEVINDQLKVVSAIKEKVIGSDGRIKDDVSHRDARELLTSINTVIPQLVKHKESVINMRRLQAIESAVIATTRELGEEVRTKFLKTLETLLQEPE